MPLRPECPPVPRACCGPSMATSGTTPHWLKRRASHNHMSQPLNIYEVHIGSWKRHGDAPQGEPDEYGNYPGPDGSLPRAARRVLHLRRPVGWSSWTTSTTWATRISRSCRLWSILSTAPGVTRRPVTTPPRRATATRRAYALYRCMPQGRHWRDYGLGARRFLR